MAKYAVFDKNGFPKAFYSKDIHGDKIPAEAIEITDEQWLEFINNQGQRRWDFKTNQVVKYEPALEDLKQAVDNLRKNKIASLLGKTDYVITKLMEARALDKTALYTELLEKYKTVLDQRQKIRDWNADIENRITKATTREELEQIKQELLSDDPVYLK